MGATRRRYSVYWEPQDAGIVFIGSHKTQVPRMLLPIPIDRVAIGITLAQLLESVGLEAHVGPCALGVPL